MLLDTHTWIWLLGDDPALKRSAREAIQQAYDSRTLYLSPISLWEITLKASRGQLPMQLPVRSWLKLGVARTKIQLIPISIEVACECAELPESFHKDPADRLIAATARVHSLTLITHDSKLLDLATKGYFKALAT